MRQRSCLQTIVLAFGWLCVSAVDAGENLYTNPRHNWSVSYPDTWTLDENNLDLVLIRPSSNLGMCGVHSGRVRFTTVKQFADSMLNNMRKIFKAQGLEQKVVSRKEWSLTGDVPVVDVVVDIVPGGRSRRVFVLWKGTGIAIDCESHLKSWPSLEGQYDQIISSFMLPQKVTKDAEKECRPPTYTDIRDGYKCAR